MNKWQHNTILPSSLNSVFLQAATVNSKLDKCNHRIRFGLLILKSKIKEFQCNERKLSNSDRCLKSTFASYFQMIISYWEKFKHFTV